jgi:hypothetical protein
MMGERNGCLYTSDTIVKTYSMYVSFRLKMETRTVLLKPLNVILAALEGA